MIWLVWRQHRQQALFALLGLAALAAFLVPTGIQMHDAFERADLPGCLRTAAGVEYVHVVNGADRAPDPVSTCQDLAAQFAGRFGSLGAIGILLWFLPLFVGLFWGAPLIARGRARHPPARVDPGGEPAALGPGQVRPGRRGRGPVDRSTWRAWYRSATPSSPWPSACSPVP